MKQFSFGSLFLAALSLASCDAPQSKENQLFKQHGLAFQHPGNWSTDDVEKVGSTGVTVTCEKNGLDESGLLTIVCIKDSLELADTQASYREEMDSATIYKMADLKFQPARPGHFGTHESLQQSFKLSMLGLPHSGWLDSFHYKGHTFMVLRQQANEDSVKNKQGFALIAKTLDIDSIR